MKRLAGVVTAVVAVSCFCSDVSAVETPEDAVVVTATRTAVTADETLAAVTVITRKDIERRQAQSVGELLAGEPGISVARSGGIGNRTEVFMRGTNSSHVLVLIDGIRIGSATAGAATFEAIPLDQIERIEIVRGPRSSLYGSEAIGGVIQIFTRRGGGALTPTLSLGGGSHDSYNVATGVSGGGEHSWFNVSASALGTKGFNSCNGVPGTAGCFVDEPDRDGFRNQAGAVRGGYRFGDMVDVDTNWLRSKGKTEFDGSFVNQAKLVEEVYGGRIRVRPLNGWQMTLLAGSSFDQSDNFENGEFQTRFNTRRDQSSLQNDFSIGTRQLVTIGVDYLNDSIDSTTPFPVTSRRNRGLFGQYQGTFGGHSLQASLRQDDNEQFGYHGTGNAAWGYSFADGLHVTASYGTAFKAPTFNDLYFPGFSNPDLRPEESSSAELGVSDKTGWGRWALNAFQTKIHDLIALDATFTPANVDSARIRGLEATLGSRVADWDVNTGLTLLEAKNLSDGANDGKLLPRRPPQALRLDLDRRFGSFRFGATLREEGYRYDDLANTSRMGGYATVDLRSEYAIDKNLVVQARVANLFDKDYETAKFFNQDGRSFFFTLRYQPVKQQ